MKPTDTPAPATMHYRLAEQGKVFSLKGQYTEALRYYREALRLLPENAQQDVFFLHYSQCVMEALELDGNYEEVIDCCDRLIEHGESVANEQGAAWIEPLIWQMLEKKAIQYVFLQENKLALEVLMQLKTTSKGRLSPVASQLLTWLQRNFHLQNRQISSLLHKHNYYIVRKDKVNPDIALKLPSDTTFSHV